MLWSVLFILLSTSGNPVVPDAAVLERVEPVFRAYSAMRTRETSETAEALEAALAPVLEERSPVTDEALAVLAGFEVGTHTGEDIHCEIVHRGKRMLPYLEKYQGARSVTIPSRPDNVKLAAATEYQLLVDRIAHGDTCEREP